MKLGKFIKRRGKLLAGLLILVVVGALAAILISLQGASLGTIKTQPPTKHPTASATALATASGSYASFNYPDSYITLRPNPTGSTMVESFVLANRHIFPASDVAVSILTLPTGNLNDDSSYHFRQLNPSTYRPDSWQINGAAIPLMQDTSAGYSKVAFLAHGQFVAEVSLTCASSADSSQLDSDLKIMLASFKWLRNG